MLSVRELYYLNEALDGKEIFGVSKGESLIEESKSNMTVEESLIKKGILNSDKESNEISQEIIKNLEEYKNSKEYINFNKTFFAMTYGEARGVYLKQNNDGDYEIKKAAKPILVHSLMRAYPFICHCKQDHETEQELELQEEEKINIEHEVIMRKYLNDVKENEWFYIKKGFLEDLYSFYIYFMKNKTVYKYDVIKMTLVKSNPREIRTDILKLFEVEEEI